jgi:DNA-binding YbaB/EbfC family protein
MAKGGFPKGMGGGMPNMNQMMKQAQKMQEQMLKMQEEMEEKKFEATAGGGAVRVVVSGKREVLEIDLKPEVVDPDDIEMLQDLMVAAVNEALRKVEADSANQMGQLTGGLNISGLF